MDDVEVGYGISIPASELSLRFSRSGGPGGQNVNKRDTRVEILFDVRSSAALTQTQRRRVAGTLRNRLDSDGVLHVIASEERTQARNRDLALERFARLMRRALAPPPPPRKKTKPSRASVDRRIKDKKRRGETKRLRRETDD